MSTSLIQARCPTCQVSGRVPSEWHGRRVRCKRCGSLFVVSILQDQEAELESRVAELSLEVQRLRKVAAVEAAKRKEAEEAVRNGGQETRQRTDGAQELHVEYKGKKYTWNGITWYETEDCTIPPLSILHMLDAHFLGNAHSRLIPSTGADLGNETPPHWDLCRCRDELDYCVECENWFCVCCGRGCQCDDEWDDSDYLEDDEDDFEDDVEYEP